MISVMQREKILTNDVFSGFDERNRKLQAHPHLQVLSMSID